MPYSAPFGVFLGVFESIVLVPTRRISKIAARRQISARGGHNHASTRYSWLARGQFDPSGSNGDGSEAWLHHWLLPVAEQTRKLGKLRDFLEIFLSPGSLLPQRVPEPEFSNFLGPFGPRWTCWTRNFARFLQPPRSCRMVKISLSNKTVRWGGGEGGVGGRGEKKTISGCPCYASA